MIDDTFKAELLGRTDLIALISRFVKLKKDGTHHKGLCPFHGEDTPSFKVSDPKGFYHCFGCGAHGNAISFLMEYQGLPFRDAIKELASIAGMQLPDLGPIDPMRYKLERQNRSAKEILEALEPELFIAVIAVSDARKGLPLSDLDHARFLLAINRIMAAIEEARGKPFTEQERTDILTPKEEEELAA